MELLFVLFAAIALFIAALCVFSKLAVDKLGARSELFGAGLATMFTGFLWNKLLDFSLLAEELPLIILSYGFLIMGLIGVTMVAVDLVKMVNEWRSAMRKADAEPSEAPKEKRSDDDVPAWKHLVE